MTPRSEKYTECAKLIRDMCLATSEKVLALYDTLDDGKTPTENPFRKLTLREMQKCCLIGMDAALYAVMDRAEKKAEKEPDNDH